MALVMGVDSSTQSCKAVVRDLATGEIVRRGRAVSVDGDQPRAPGRCSVASCWRRTEPKPLPFRETEGSKSSNPERSARRES